LLVANSTTHASEHPQSGVYDVQKSEIRILVYRGGLLGLFGHNHVISTNDIEGRIVIPEDIEASSVILAIPVESFEVDKQAFRVEEGKEFKSEVSDKDKRGTKKNMLGAKLLNAANFSSITIESNSWSGELPGIVVNATFTVKDQPNPVEFPASVDMNSNEIVVTGELTVTHEQLGLRPFSAVLGSLSVRDEMEIKFYILAIRADD
jgi:polyisoprenoid-binding protein YceI